MSESVLKELERMEIDVLSADKKLEIECKKHLWNCRNMSEDKEMSLKYTAIRQQTKFGLEITILGNG